MTITPFRRHITGFFTAVAVLLCIAVHGQRHEIGLQGGMGNLVGDVGRTNFILQMPFRDMSTYGLPAYGGIIYRMNFNPYQTLRFNIGYANVQFSDAYAKEDYRRQRWNSERRFLPETNSIYNADAQFEYNFLPVNNEQKGMLSPYIFGGIGAVSYYDRRITIDVDKIGTADYPISSVLYMDLKPSVPFGAGLKYKFNYNMAIFGEVKLRYTFTDNIDYSNLLSKNVKMLDSNGKIIKEAGLTVDQKNYRDNFISEQQIGNPNSKDWINTVTIGISYSFGRPPCYCD